MKKYHNLGELLLDFRKHRGMTQLDLSAILEVDVRTVIRWEKNESLIKPEKEIILIENLGIPHQVIRNLNTDHPIPVYFDFKRWLYALSLLSSMVRSSKEFKTEYELHTSRIETLKDEKDIEFINYIQKNQKNCSPLRKEVVETAARILPEINLVIRDQSGFHGGHISILPIKYEAYEAIRDQKMKEQELKVQHLTSNMDDDPKVYYFYSIYSSSLENNFYLVNRLLFYFKKLYDTNYIFAGITFQELKIERFREMGFQVIWQKPVADHPEWTATFLTGNFDAFLFNEKEC
jgi:transcriptional regulator with XRE-family HTH domain